MSDTQSTPVQTLASSTEDQNNACANDTCANDNIVLSVTGVSKKFCRSLKRSLLYGIKDIATEMTGWRSSQDTLRKGEFWALEDVSFQVRQGEALGLIGKNGSGKSTLLRMIAGLIKPDTGSIEIKGRVAPLIALGAGFSPILTGRENIYANMSILGLSKKEIKERFDEVVAFAEVGEAIDAPVQTYSSGMAARLGFASAIFTEPDILLIDEVLAVGDAKFQAKCSTKLAELSEKGTTFILVSHNSMVINAVCSSAIYLHQGKLQARGSADAIVKKYESDLFSSEIQAAQLGTLSLPAKAPQDSLGADITSVCFKNDQGEIVEAPQTGQRCLLCVGCQVHKPFDHFALGIAINDFALSGQTSLVLESHYDGEVFQLAKGHNEIQIEISYLGLRPSVYNMEIYLKKENPHADLDIVDFFKFKVIDADDQVTFIGKSLFFQPRKWRTVSMLTHHLVRDHES
jgi:lipopolysaccharide transport system ATP-binding protein